MQPRAPLLMHRVDLCTRDTLLISRIYNRWYALLDLWWLLHTENSLRTGSFSYESWLQYCLCLSFSHIWKYATYYSQPFYCNSIVWYITVWYIIFFLWYLINKAFSLPFSLYTNTPEKNEMQYFDWLKACQDKDSSETLYSDKRLLFRNIIKITPAKEKKLVATSIKFICLLIDIMVMLN